jgi:N-acetylglucosamine kinase-like BadF-type ATPase
MGDARLGVLVADVGKTRCRVLFIDPDGAVRWSAGTDGSPGLATTGADELIAQRILALASSRSVAPIGIVSAGVAGALAAPVAAQRLAARLADALGTGALVTSDIVTAHLGALGGGVGTALVAGTGAVAMGIAADGTTTVVDGRGPALGDLGSGAWIGRAGLTAALRSRDGVAARTGLDAALDALLAPHADLQRWLDDGGNLGGRLGEFAPAVLDAAEHGDEVAGAIVADAVRLLTATSAGAGVHPVSVLGGLMGHRWFRQQLIHSLREAGLDPVAPLGSALDGAHIAAVRSGLPHERHFHRA